MKTPLFYCFVVGMGDPLPPLAEKNPTLTRFLWLFTEWKQNYIPLCPFVSYIFHDLHVLDTGMVFEAAGDYTWKIKCFRPWNIFYPDPCSTVDPRCCLPLYRNSWALPNIRIAIKDQHRDIRFYRRGHLCLFCLIQGWTTCGTFSKPELTQNLFLFFCYILEENNVYICVK